jgi:flagellar biosynthesis component FlhA
VVDDLVNEYLEICNKNESWSITKTRKSIKIDLIIWTTFFVINLIGVYLINPLLELDRGYSKFTVLFIFEKILGQLTIGGFGIYFIITKSSVENKLHQKILTLLINFSYFILIISFLLLSHLGI